jgi:hypothetical protein
MLLNEQYRDFVSRTQLSSYNFWRFKEYYSYEFTQGNEMQISLPVNIAPFTGCTITLVINEDQLWMSLNESSPLVTIGDSIEIDIDSTTAKTAFPGILMVDVRYGNTNIQYALGEIFKAHSY